MIQAGIDAIDRTDDEDCVRRVLGASLHELLREADARGAIAVSVTTLTSLVTEFEHPEDGER
jgi:hypothetical protein